MKKGLSMSIKSELQNLKKVGNINSYIQCVLENYKGLRGDRQEYIYQLNEFIKKYSQNISIKTRKAIQEFSSGKFSKDANYIVGLEDLINIEKQKRPKSKLSQAIFPAATPTQGFLYRIKVGNTKSLKKNMSPKEIKLLDKVGSALFSYIVFKTNIDHLWNPTKYCFLIYNAYNEEVSDVKGESNSISLIISLYSHLFDVKVPVDIAATGKIDREGRVWPVSSMYVKMSVLQAERDYIRRLIVAKEQDIPNEFSHFDLIEVEDVREVINSVFGEEDLDLSGLEIDSEEEVRVLDKLYENYLFDTCIKNADLLINYIKKKERKFGKIDSEDIKNKFRCYWRLGSCYCHKGNIDKSKAYLKEADNIYNSNKGSIGNQYYYECKNQYAVLLKDIFRYDEAEKIHLQIDKEMRDNRCTNYEIGINLSSLSQLYLAKREFEKAQKHQEKALDLIDKKKERHRNLNYLAQIYARKSDFKNERDTIDKALHSLNRAKLDEKNRGFQRSFIDLVEAECVYLEILNSDSSSKDQILRIENLITRYPTVDNWVIALICKFCGAGLLLMKESEGADYLEKAICFFDKQETKMDKVIGVTTRIESILHRLTIKNFMTFIMDLKMILDALLIQKDIKHFYQNNIDQLNGLLNLSKHTQKDVDSLKKILIEIKNKIPY